MGGVWTGGPGPDLSQSLAFQASGRNPESGVRALLPRVGVVVAPLGLGLGLIALRTPLVVLVPLWLSRFASLWRSPTCGWPASFYESGNSGSGKPGPGGTEACCSREKAVTYSPSDSDFEEV